MLCDYISSTSGANGLLLNSSGLPRVANGSDGESAGVDLSSLLNFRGDKLEFLNRAIRSKSKRNIFRRLIEPLFGFDEPKSLKISLLGLFELNTRSGLSELAAAKLAVKHINERNLLDGYTLELKTNDTQVREI
jgi:hypothetical protein